MKADSVILFARYYSPDSSAGVFHVPLESGDEVDVQVHYGLPGFGAAVHSDVESVRLELFDKQCPALLQKFLEGQSFSGGAVEKIGNVPAGDYEQVTG